MTRLIGSRRTLFNPPKTIAWTTNQIPEIVTTSLPSPSYVTNDGTSINGYGIFTGVLPAGDIYFDVTLAQGYSGYVAFLGLSNTNSAFAYGTSANYQAWYWSGSWFGNYSQVAGPPGALIADTYRIAIRRNNNTFYIKGSTYGSSAIGGIPTGSSIYLMMMTQGGYKLPNASILNGGAYYIGSGGLY